MPKAPMINGLEMVIQKEPYKGLWEIRYVSGGLWAGPFATKKEAVQFLDERKD